MFDEGQQDDDDLSERFLRCAWHQAKLAEQRWKFWSGTVPEDVHMRLHHLESRLAINQNSMEQVDVKTKVQTETKRSSIKAVHPRVTIDERFLKRTEPNRDTIIIEGPNLPRIASKKSSHHFWCCH